MKRMIYGLLITLSILVAAILFLLSKIESTSELLSGFNLSFAIVIATGVPAVLFIIRGILEKTTTQFRMMFVILGVGFLFVAVVALIGALAIPDSLVLPLICVVLALGLFFMVLARGTKKWDKGHNQDPNYKNYYQRKEEEIKNQIQVSDKEAINTTSQNNV